MPGIARQNDTVTTGHGCDTTTTIQQGSPNVRINGSGAAYAGAALTGHTIPVGVPPVCVGHSAQVNAGYGRVLVNGRPIARIGDSADLGQISTASANVLTIG
jgi:uncharacterized Zn-binding protein involved in type VI secretion